MGSPSSRLNTPERLRPWLESGVEFVFRPGGVDAQTQPTPEALQPAPQAAPSAQGASQPAPARTTTVEPPDQVRTGEGPPGFPEPWATFLGKVLATHTMVWTYMELGLDLGGQPDPARRNLMGSLIKYLDLPPGPVAFWPVAVLRDGALQPDRTMFWKGWGQWRTPNIVCFGTPALEVILPDADPAATTHMLDNVMVHVLPDVGSLLSMLPHERQLAVDVLKSIR